MKKYKDKYNIRYKIFKKWNIEKIKRLNLNEWNMKIKCKNIDIKI